MRSDIIEHKLDRSNEWEQWDRWLKGHLDIEFASLHRALGQLLGEERARLERKTQEFSVKLAKLAGAVDVLRGKESPPPAKFPSVKVWEEGGISYAGDVVTHDGNTWQARCDTAQAPGMGDWACLARAGRDGAGMTVRGTYDWKAEYRLLDVVVTNGSSFCALKDAPGPCPGDDWHLLASRGSRGGRGPSGITGLRGERGAAAPTIQSWCIDRARYTATPIHSDGTLGPTLELRALFEQFLLETQR